MGLGSTAKKIQTLADRAEQLYVKLKEVHERVLSVETTVEATQDQVQALERELDHQRVVLEAIADEHGIDVDQVVADAAIEDVHATDDAPEAADTDAATGGDAGGSDGSGDGGGSDGSGDGGGSDGSGDGSGTAAASPDGGDGATDTDAR